MTTSQRYPAFGLLLLVLALAACSSSARRASPPTSTRAPTTPATVPVASASSDRPEDRCDGTTYDLERCLSRVFSDVDRERTRLSARVIATSHQPDPSFGKVPNLKKQLQRSEEAFVTYRKRTCDAVLTASIEGSWRGIETLNCNIKLTRERIALLQEILDGKGVSS